MQLSIASVAFVVSFYGFVIKEPRLREGSDGLLLSVVLTGIGAVSGAFAGVSILTGHPIVAKSLVVLSVFFVIVGWCALLHALWSLYGRLYFMRESRFWKYVAPFSWIIRPSRRYVAGMQSRTSLVIAGCDLTPPALQPFLGGCCILIIADPGADTSFIVDEVLKDGLTHAESCDYVCCQQSPCTIWDRLTKKMSFSELKKLHFIDAFTPAFGYSDDIWKHKIEDLRAKDGNNVFVIPGRSIAGIHTASNTSWYVNKKDSTGPRPPHRTVYDRLSALMPRTSIDQILSYFVHCVASERAYGMVSVIVESSSSPLALMATLRDISDIVIEVKGYGDNASVNVAKILA
jgi:hypothetical protein